MLVAGDTRTEGVSQLTFDVLGDTVYLVVTTVPEGSLISKVTIGISGEGVGVGIQALRGFVVRGDGTFGLTAAVEVMSGDPVGWVDLIAESPIAASGEIGVGVYVTGPDNVVAMFGTAGVGEETLTGTATGDPLVLGSLSAVVEEESIAVWATYAAPWAKPDEDNLYLASLGYGTAQRVLGAVAADPRTTRRARASWHGTFLDTQPQGASLALVQTGGPLADFVGERVQITYGQRSTVVYVHRLVDLDLDDDTAISLSRRAWQALAPLAVGGIQVSASLIGPDRVT